MSVMKDNNPLDHVLAPSAGQDTGQLRDEIAHAVPVWCGLLHEEAYQLADVLLSGPLARVVAERDEARATVQRVRELAEALCSWRSGHLVLPHEVARDLAAALAAPAVEDGEG